MKKLILLTAVGLGLLMTALADETKMESKTKVSDLSWMAGSWKCEIWGGTFEEHWTKPNGESMLAVGRLVTNGKTQFMEFISIEPHGDSLTMFIMLESPSKGPKTAVPFKLTRHQNGVAVFENPKHDYPTKITYRKTAKGMDCRIEGVQNGKASHDDFHFVKG